MVLKSKLEVLSKAGVELHVFHALQYVSVIQSSLKLFNRAGVMSARPSSSNHVTSEAKFFLGRILSHKF
jgi:hypothetical protein